MEAELSSVGNLPGLGREMRKGGAAVLCAARCTGPAVCEEDGGPLWHSREVDIVGIDFGTGGNQYEKANASELFFKRKASVQICPYTPPRTGRIKRLISQRMPLNMA